MVGDRQGGSEKIQSVTPSTLIHIRLLVLHGQTYSFATIAERKGRRWVKRVSVRKLK